MNFHLTVSECWSKVGPISQGILCIFCCLATRVIKANSICSTTEDPAHIMSVRLRHPSGNKHAKIPWLQSAYSDWSNILCYWRHMSGVEETVLYSRYGSFCYCSLGIYESVRVPAVKTSYWTDMLLPHASSISFLFPELKWHAGHCCANLYCHYRHHGLEGNHGTSSTTFEWWRTLALDQALCLSWSTLVRDIWCHHWFQHVLFSSPIFQIFRHDNILCWPAWYCIIDV